MKKGMQRNTEDKSEDRAERQLSIYARLKQGKIIYKKEESERYGVAPRTIQRDISGIQRFLENQSIETGELSEIIFVQEAGGYKLQTRYSNHLNGKEILAVAKVLLESRSLMKKELFPIIDKIIRLCSDEAEENTAKRLIENEREHYVELKHGKDLLDRIWELEQAVKEQKYIEIKYRKLKNQELVSRKLKPVGVMFSEYYFYLTAFIDDIDKKEAFRNPKDIFPTIYRVDRLQEIQILEQHFSISYAQRFQEGEFRKRVQFMFGGKLRRIRLKCRAYALEAVLDKLPTAEVEQECEDGFIVRAEVYGDGVDMWVKSQGDAVEVLK